MNENNEELKGQEMPAPDDQVQAEDNSASPQPSYSAPQHVQDLVGKVDKLRKQISGEVIGQDLMIDLLMAALLADGHILLEGVPGVAKTLTAKLFARSIDAQYGRVQFTPDLMPSDILGTSVFDPSNGSFDFKKGPVFTNILLIDEINRSPAKTQSALFEVMEERQVTIDGNTYKFEPPFTVIATQNPIEQEGTYRLPEAQLDRFLFKINVDYPKLADEIKILDLHTGDGIAEAFQPHSTSAVFSREDLANLRDTVKKVKVGSDIKTYIAGIANGSREHRSIYLGISPRASVYLMNASKAWAAMKGRDFVTPDDVREMAFPVLSHRMILTPEKEMDGVLVEEVLQELLDQTEVPR